MRSAFVKTLLGVCVAFVAVFGVEFLVEWWRLGTPGLDKLSWSESNLPKLVDTLSPMARAYNNILAMLLATIGLAIPLTANMHTPKLIDMFLRDRLNQAMLLVMAFGAANVLFVSYMIGPGFAPMWAYRFAVYFALLGWALLIPYFFYVVRFLDPTNILVRLKQETSRLLDRVRRGGVDYEREQTLVHERIFQIGTIVLKSLDRADRGVALEGVWTLKKLIDYHGEQKRALPDAWFKVDRGDFVGLSAEAIELLNEDRTWFEMKALNQLFYAYQSALAKTSDVVSSISDAVRAVAVNHARLGDTRALDLDIRYFNTFLRESIKKKDVHSIYDVFYEYRLLARDLADHPDKQRDIARHVRHYGALAQGAGFPFVQQLAAFELGYMARRAYEVDSPAAADLLREAVAVPPEEKGTVVPLVLKAKVLLGGFFLQHGRAAEAELVRRDLARVAPARLLDAERDLLSAERCFFEVTNRQENLEYVRPERREHVQAFVKRLCAGAADASGPAAAPESGAV
ncbi:MAG: DUF2254 domain-containing protein [Myxococcales bacterium]|nr:DUF2254 domain-containing protein [Myxococcales bacterium]